ncbi:MAG: type II toxin-antitoxin system Phd/YefM family antitoxin [Propionibacteriaceae bacterium]|nr:type II toxin-antitoxin system Phd/YefM family antitoxin [Propionibacteriaceae bacterium]
MSATEFNRAPSVVKRKVLDSGEPVMILDHARPSLVVLTYDDYAALSGQPAVGDLAKWLQMDEEIEFEPESVGLGLQVVEL